HVPARRGRRRAAVTDRGDLVRSLVLVPRAERAELRLLGSLGLDEEVLRLAAPLARDDHPALRERIVSQLRHASVLRVLAGTAFMPSPRIQEKKVAARSRSSGGTVLSFATASRSGTGSKRPPR